MMIDIVGLTALLLLVTAGVWLALRARRAWNPMVKWAGLILSSLIALVGTAAAGITLLGFYRVNYPPYRGTAPDIHVAGTPDQVARGARFGTFCAGCHSPDGKPRWSGTILQQAARRSGPCGPLTSRPPGRLPIGPMAK